MRTIKLKMEIDDEEVEASLTEKQYNDVKTQLGIDPLLVTLNKMCEEINKHENLKNNPFLR